MILIKIFTTAFIVLIIQLQVKAQQKFELTFLNFTCWNPSAKENKPLITAYQCGLSKNMKRRTLNYEVIFGKDIFSFDINIIVVLPRKTSDFVLLNLTKLNGCQMLSNKNLVPLLQLSRTILNHYSNLPKHCPLRANVPYYIRGFRLDIDRIPAFTFENDMNAKFEYVIDKKVSFKGVVNTHVGLKRNLY